MHCICNQSLYFSKSTTIKCTNYNDNPHLKGKKHHDYIQLWPLHKNDPLHVHALKLHMAPEEVNIEEDWARQGYLLKYTICWLIIINPMYSGSLPLWNWEFLWVYKCAMKKSHLHEHRTHGGRKEKWTMALIT